MARQIGRKQQIYKIQLTVIDEVGKKLGNALEKAVDEGIKSATVIFVTEGLLSEVPVDTGELARSISYVIKKTPDGPVGVISMKKYGKVLEYTDKDNWISRAEAKVDSRISHEWDRIIDKHLDKVLREPPKKVARTA